MVSGNAVTGNTASGVLINVGASSNLIGTDGDGTNDANEGNLISDNATGILVSGVGTDGNLVQGNFIGTDASGLGALPNTLDGIRIADSASGNIIGGEIFATGNIVSGNTRHGVYVTGTANNTQISGNFIGAAANGTAALPNLSGVVLEGFNNIVGVVDDASQGNLISGNLNHGVLIIAEAADGNRIAGNLIGTTQNGTAILGNQENGVLIQSGPDSNIIGMRVDGSGSEIERNIIAGNGQSGTFDGVLVTGASTDSTLIAGNYIGTDFGGMSAIANTRDGIRVSGGPTNTLIGGPSTLTASAPVVDDLEDLANGADASSRFIAGVGVTITPESGLAITARTYNDAGSEAFATGGNPNQPGTPANVSGVRFISTVVPGSHDFKQAEPMEFALSKPVRGFGFTTLDLLETGTLPGESVTVTAYDAAGNVVDSQTRTAPVIATADGVDFDWFVSSANDDIIRVVLRGRSNKSASCFLVT